MLSTLVATGIALVSTAGPNASYRESQAGWTILHLSGSPRQIGFEYGSLASKEIADANRVLRVYLKKSTDKDWNYYRRESKRVLWPRVDEEYREELRGMAAGLQSKGVHFDLDDVLAQNGWIEMSWYYVPMEQAKAAHKASESKAPKNCSAFIATGSETKDGGIVMAHNAWIDYCIGERWNLVLDIKPMRGLRMLMDSWPGFIGSGDDFAINSSGMMLTETTISGFNGFNPAGIPEFVRMRKAIQYSRSLSDMARIMTEGNNGGYANMWLMGDAKTNEIGRLELGLKNVIFSRTTDGDYVSSNFPEDPKLIKEETDGDLKNTRNMCGDRRCRWIQLMTQYKGKVDASLAEAFLGDHYSELDKTAGLNFSGLCGHGDTDGRSNYLFTPGMPTFNPAGAVQGKVVTSTLTRQMSFLARMGHPCGMGFKAKPFLAAHPEWGWEKGILDDMPGHPWTQVKSIWR